MSRRCLPNHYHPLSFVYAPLHLNTQLITQCLSRILPSYWIVTCIHVKNDWVFTCFAKKMIFPQIWVSCVCVADLISCILSLCLYRGLHSPQFWGEINQNYLVLWIRDWSPFTIVPYEYYVRTSRPFLLKLHLIMVWCSSLLITAISR